MKDDPVPDDHHVSRYCSPVRVAENEDRPLPTAFQLRNGEEYVSVDWLEFHDIPDRAAQLDRVQQLFEEQRHFTLSPNGLFAVLEAGESKDAVREQTPDDRALEITHQPDPDIEMDSHSGIFNVNHNPASALMIATILSETVEEVRVPAG